MRSPRRTVAIGAVAAVGLLATGVAGAAGAAGKKNEIRIVGGTTVKPGHYVKDNVRFTPLNKTVKSGATVKLVNRGENPEPHTISFIAKKYLPKEFETAVDAKLREAHQPTRRTKTLPLARRSSTTASRCPQAARSMSTRCSRRTSRAIPHSSPRARSRSRSR